MNVIYRAAHHIRQVVCFEHQYLTTTTTNPSQERKRWKVGSVEELLCAETGHSRQKKAYSNSDITRTPHDENSFALTLAFGSACGSIRFPTRRHGDIIHPFIENGAVRASKEAPMPAIEILPYFRSGRQQYGECCC